MSGQGDEASKLQNQNIVEAMSKEHEKELEQLERQYKIIEGNRVTVDQEREFKLAKISFRVNYLRGLKKHATDAELAQDVDLQDVRFKNLPVRFKELMEQKDAYEPVIDVGYITLYLLKVHIGHLKSDILAMKTAGDTDNEEDGIEPPCDITSDTVEKFESKLDKGQKDVNWENVKFEPIRVDIEDYLRERTHFMMKMKDLQITLCDGKKKSMKVIGDSLTAYETRLVYMKELHVKEFLCEEDYVKEIPLLRRDYRKLQVLNKPVIQKATQRLSFVVSRFEFLRDKLLKRDLKELKLKQKLNFLIRLSSLNMTIKDCFTRLRMLCYTFEPDNVDSLFTMIKMQERETNNLYNHFIEVHFENKILNELLVMMKESTASFTESFDDLVKLEFEACSLRTSTMKNQQERMAKCLTSCFNGLYPEKFRFSFSTSPFYSLPDEMEINYDTIDIILRLFENRIVSCMQSIAYFETKIPEMDLPSQQCVLLRENVFYVIERSTFRPAAACPICVYHGSKGESVICPWRGIAVLEEDKALTECAYRILAQYDIKILRFSHTVARCRRTYIAEKVVSGSCH